MSVILLKQKQLLLYLHIDRWARHIGAGDQILRNTTTTATSYGLSKSIRTSIVHACASPFLQLWQYTFSIFSSYGGELL